MCTRANKGEHCRHRGAHVCTVGPLASVQEPTNYHRAAVHHALLRYFCKEPRKETPNASSAFDRYSGTCASLLALAPAALWAKRAAATRTAAQWCCATASNGGWTRGSRQKESPSGANLPSTVVSMARKKSAFLDRGANKAGAFLSEAHPAAWPLHQPTNSLLAVPVHGSLFSHLALGPGLHAQAIETFFAHPLSCRGTHTEG